MLKSLLQARNPPKHRTALPDRRSVKFHTQVEPEACSLSAEFWTFKRLNPQRFDVNERTSNYGGNCGQ